MPAITKAAVDAMNSAYRNELRLWMNLYLPSVKLLKKTRVGSKLRRIYSPGTDTAGPSAGVRSSRQQRSSRAEEAALDARPVQALREYRWKTCQALRNGQPASQSEGRGSAHAGDCGRDARCKGPKAGLSHLAWKSRKERRIPTFPQARRRRRYSAYIINVSTATSRVTFSNGLTRHAHHSGCSIHRTDGVGGHERGIAASRRAGNHGTADEAG